MGLFFLILLLILLATGAFWLVVKVALGVALGVLLAVAAVVTIVLWRLRRAFGAGSRWRQVRGGDGRHTGSSEVKTYYRDPRD